MKEDYVKTGEDKNFEYYRNDSEVLSDDGEAELYEEILGKKDEFNVKINGTELKIKKRTVNRIMILSDSQPEEQILFSHYKTVESDKTHDKKKAQDLLKENLKPKEPNPTPNQITNNSQKETNNSSLFPYTKISEPLSESKENTNNVAMKVNVPSNNQNDKENLRFKKTENIDDLLLVGLPPEAIKLKWFYLLLLICGIVDAVYFFYFLIKYQFSFITFVIMIFGCLNILTGIVGFNKINNKQYDSLLLLIFTFACAILAITKIISFLFSSTIGTHFIFGLIVNTINLIFAVLCILFTIKLKKKENETKLSQMQQLL